MLTRDEKRAEARRLKDEIGLNSFEIAERLDAHPSTVRNWLAGGTCKCGAPITWSATECSACAPRRQRKSRPDGFAKGQDACPDCNGPKWKRSTRCEPCKLASIGSPQERLLARVAETETGCWEWQGPLGTTGYAWISINGVLTQAHRASYEAFLGPIPEGLVIDHLCMNPPCVNPGHLEPVTQAENTRRWAATVTHCPRGHEYSPENTYLRPDGHRFCRQCNAIAGRKYQARKREAAAS